MSLDAVDADAVVDLRSMPHSWRRLFVCTLIERMAVGKSFVLVNDHAPVRLRRYLQETFAGTVGWESLESGPPRWRVRITRNLAQPAD